MLNFSGLTKYLEKNLKHQINSRSLKLISCTMLINFLIFFAMIINKQRKPYKILYGLRITFNDHAFFGDQKAEP